MRNQILWHGSSARRKASAAAAPPAWRAGQEGDAVEKCDDPLVMCVGWACPNGRAPRRTAASAGPFAHRTAERCGVLQSPASNGCAVEEASSGIRYPLKRLVVGKPASARAGGGHQAPMRSVSIGELKLHRSRHIAVAHLIGRQAARRACAAARGGSVERPGDEELVGEVFADQRQFPPPV